MRPRLLRDAGICRVLLQNGMPAAQTVRVVAETPQGGLYFDGAQKQIGLAAGQRGVVDFYVQAMKRPFIGRTTRRPFVLHVNTLTEPPGPPTPSLQGAVEIRPQLPIWLALLLLALLVAFCGLLYWLLMSVPALSRFIG